jgi:hypothetical protein
MRAASRLSRSPGVGVSPNRRQGDTDVRERESFILLAILP